MKEADDEDHWHAHTRGLPWGLPEVVGTIQQVHCSQRRLQLKGLEFHVCTINKSAHTKKSGNWFYDPRMYIYIYIYIYKYKRDNNKRRLKLSTKSFPLSIIRFDMLTTCPHIWNSKSWVFIMFYLYLVLLIRYNGILLCGNICIYVKMHADIYADICIYIYIRASNSTHINVLTFSNTQYSISHALKFRHTYTPITPDFRTKN